MNSCFHLPIRSHSLPFKRIILNFKSKLDFDLRGFYKNESIESIKELLFILLGVHISSDI